MMERANEEAVDEIEESEEGEFEEEEQPRPMNILDE